jgi:adenosylhomocysteine/aminodeoxyfutalosine nucleosidase
LTIGIIGAMREEIEPILKLVGDYEVVEYGKNRFFKANYNNHKLIIAYSKIGKIFASITATIMIEKFKTEKILFSGVAGAINRNLKIGDLIYATKVAQHDLNITAFGHPLGYVPEGSVFVKSDDYLNSIAEKVAKELNIKLAKGIIVTGDQFINSQEKKDLIFKEFQADAIEMEGSSIAVVCDSLNIPFFIIRAISDSADNGADFDFDTFLQSSAINSAKFIISMVSKI